MLPSNHRRRIGRGERDADMEAFRRLAERKKAANDLVSQKAYAEAADEFRGVVQDGRQQLGGEQQDGLRGQLEALVATSSNNLGLCYLKLFRHADCVRAINELFRTTHARSVRAELRNCKKMTDHPSLPQNLPVPDVVRGLFDCEAAFADARCMFEGFLSGQRPNFPFEMCDVCLDVLRVLHLGWMGETYGEDEFVGQVVLFCKALYRRGSAFLELGAFPAAEQNLVLGCKILSREWAGAKKDVAKLPPLMRAIEKKLHECKAECSACFSASPTVETSTWEFGGQDALQLREEQVAHPTDEINEEIQRRFADSRTGRPKVARKLLKPGFEKAAMEKVRALTEAWTATDGATFVERQQTNKKLGCYLGAGVDISPFVTTDVADWVFIDVAPIVDRGHRDFAQGLRSAEALYGTLVAHFHWCREQKLFSLTHQTHDPVGKSMEFRTDRGQRLRYFYGVDLNRAADRRKLPEACTDVLVRGWLPTPRAAVVELLLSDRYFPRLERVHAGHLHYFSTDCTPAEHFVPVPKGVTRILNLPRGYFSIEWWEGDMFLLEDPLFNFVSCTGQLRHDTWSPENVKRLAEGWGR